MSNRFSEKDVTVPSLEEAQRHDCCRATVAVLCREAYALTNCVKLTASSL